MNAVVVAWLRASNIEVSPWQEHVLRAAWATLPLEGRPVMDVPSAGFSNDQGNWTTHRGATGDTSNPPPTADRDGDDGLPDMPMYEGPQVSDQPALINPSAGVQGPHEQGPTDINPVGLVERPGDVPVSRFAQVFPSTTID